MSISRLTLHFDQLSSCWLLTSSRLIVLAALLIASATLPYFTKLTVAPLLQLFLQGLGLCSLSFPGGILATVWLLVLLIYARVSMILSIFLAFICTECSVLFIKLLNKYIILLYFICVHLFNILCEFCKCMWAFFSLERSLL